MGIDSHVAQHVEVTFDGGLVLEAYGEVHVEKGQLYADGDMTVQKSDILYMSLAGGDFYQRQAGEWEHLVSIAPGEYVVCRGGLYERLLP